MSAEVLNQEEIDALLKGVDAGAVATENVAPPGEARGYDLATQTRIVRGRLPTLEMINERFARLLRIGLYDMMRRTPAIAVAPVQLIKFGEYVHTLNVPCSLNLVKLAPLRGTALMMLDARLVFTIVDSFFGGNGRDAKIEGREFTSTENRIIHMVLRHACAGLTEAWSPVAALGIEYLNSEMNPQFANIVSPSETVVVAAFGIEFEGAGGRMHGGQFHVTLPYSMVEPMREVLDAGLQSDSFEGDERWSATLRDELQEAEVEVIPVLGRARLSVGRLLDLRAGDVIPCDFDGQVTLYAEGVPLLCGSYGVSRGQQAVKIQSRIARGRALHPRTQTTGAP